MASSQDGCVTCHRDETPGIVHQSGISSMAAAEVSCRDCHEVPEDYPGGQLIASVYLVEMLPQLLNAYPKVLQKVALDQII